MIINGGSRSNRKWFAKHLTNGVMNERVTLCEVRDLTAATVAEAFQEMEAVASGTRCRNYFYHANLNPLEHEHLTGEQWTRAVDLLETNLGLEGHARFVVEHEKHGRVHRHVVWSRINVETMRAVRMDHDYQRHQATARQLEQEFQLVPVPSVLAPDREGERPERRPEHWEVQRGKRSGIDPVVVKEEVTGLWQATDSGKAFAAALAEHGYVLARGDRRDFCLVDSAGHEHSLGRRLKAVNAASVRERMADIDRVSLPSVAAARALQRRKRVMVEVTRQGRAPEREDGQAREADGER